MNAAVDQMPVPQPRPMPELGMHPGMPEDEYRKAPGANKSFLDDLAISPALAQWRRKHPDPQTDAMAVGSAFHCLVLEPEEFDKRFVRSEYPSFQSKEARAWRDAQEDKGLTILRSHSPTDDPIANPSQWDRAHAMAAAVRAHPTASILLEPTSIIPEVPVFWIDQFCPEYRRLCKAKLDAWNHAHQMIVDLKKVPVECAAESKFARKIHDYRYHVQAAFYTDGVREAIHEWPRAFVFVAVEEEPPYQIGIYTLPREWIEQGRRQYIRDLAVLSQCMDSGEWPSYSADIRELGMPGYAKFVPIS